MYLSFLIHILSSYLMALLAMAFFTLLERKAIGYFQLRKGPNKVGIMGLPQPFADALKLFCKEQAKPNMSNFIPFLTAPMLSLFLALLLWSLYPHSSPSIFLTFSAILFLCISSLNVYATLSAGWFSNSKYALLGALRGVAQTISYEVSMALILISALILSNTYSLLHMKLYQWTPLSIMMFPLFIIWFITMLAETNRTPFDFAEGESELVSGFNTEYSSGSFALIFMAEYSNIIGMSFISSTLFMTCIPINCLMSDAQLILQTLFLSFLFIWIRATFPRLRYDRLMSLTWKSFLPISLGMLFISIPYSLLI
uniref:NADH dehydrogenase subunit 1 n=1 Tax=Glyphohesione klatti TaxID=3053539 RepID=UPI0030E35F0B